MAFRLQLGAADAQVVPRIRLHPDLVPQALLIHAREVDVEIGEGGPGAVVRVVAELLADGGNLAVLLLGFLHEIGDVHKELTIEMRAAGAVEPEKIVSRSGRSFCGRACGNVLHGNVVDRDRNLVLVAPVLGEFVEPGVVCRNEVGPLHDRQRLVGGQGLRNEWRRKHGCRAGCGKREARSLQEPASRNAPKFVRHLRSPSLFGCSWRRRFPSEDRLAH